MSVAIPILAGPAGGYRDVNRAGLAEDQRMMSGKPVVDASRIRVTKAKPKTKTETRMRDASATGTPPIETRELIPVKFLGASPWQPRKEFDPAALCELGDSIKANGGNWSDLIVWRVSRSYIVEHATKGSGKKLPDYFVLAGERRLRAALTVEWPSLWCRVIEGSAAEAERMARLENLHRADLSPIEAIRNLKAMVDAIVHAPPPQASGGRQPPGSSNGETTRSKRGPTGGLTPPASQDQSCWTTQADVAKAVGLTPAALSNQLRVLELPSEWLDLISQERLTVTHLRSLVAWKDRPTVLAAARETLDKDYTWGLKNGAERMPTVKEWDDAVLDAVQEVTRPLAAGKHGDLYECHQVPGMKRAIGRMFLSKEDLPLPAAVKASREKLDIVEVKGLGERAFNVSEWTKLSEQAKAARKAGGARGSRASAKGDAREPRAPQLTAAEKRQKTLDAAKAFARKLYRYKLTWLQKAIGGRMRDASAMTLLKHVLAFAANGSSQSYQRGAEFGEAVIANGGEQKAARSGYTTRTDVWKTFSTMLASGGRQPPGSSNGETGRSKRAPTGGLTPPASQRHVDDVARACLTKWYAHSFEGYSTDLPPAFLEAAAVDLGIDFAAEWKLDRDFLELFTHEGLVGLGHEWKISNLIFDLKRGEVIERILVYFDAENPKLRPDFRLPACLAKLKPVSLTN